MILHTDDNIKDSEIRIIRNTGLIKLPEEDKPEKSQRKRPSPFRWIIIAVVAIAVIVAIILFLYGNDSATEKMPPTLDEQYEEGVEEIIVPEDILASTPGHVIAVDTVIDNKGLLILSPVNLRPRLVIGSENLNDSAIVMATQAADIRRDNGQIAGTFVMKGELISKGEAKAGFCSIINDEMSIGISDATPMLEQALSEDGYFFRQYPLVVGGQLIENKPKNKAIRKALAETDGKIYVIMSKDKLTFHDFSQLLVDAGVRNAIYLVGSTSYGFYTDDTGQRILTGLVPTNEMENVSYIVWE